MIAQRPPAQRGQGAALFLESDEHSSLKVGSRESRGRQMGSASATGEGVAGATPETDVKGKRSVRREDLSQAHTRTASRARLRQPGLRQPGLRAVSPRPMLPRPRPPPRPSLRPLGLLTSTCTACALRRAQKTFVLPVWSPQLLARSDRHGDADSSSPGMLQSHEIDSAGPVFQNSTPFPESQDPSFLFRA